MMTKDRVRLTAEARLWFRDIGDREGVVIAMDGFAIVEWPGIPERHRIKTSCLDVVE